MAELIPLEFRIQGLRQKLLLRWLGVIALMGIVCGVAITYAYKWRDDQASVHNQVSAEHQQKSGVITRRKELNTRLLVLSDRMKKMEQLRNDAVLISLLSTISHSASDKDLISYLNIDAHANTRLNSASTESGNTWKYTMNVAGYTVSQESYSELFTRLTKAGKEAATPFQINLNSGLKTADYLDGHLLHFQIVCERPTKAG